MATYLPKALSVSKNGDTYNYDLGNIHSGVCSSLGINQTKTVTISEVESLTEGLCVRVIFENAQGYDGVPNLQINSLDAIPIKRSGGENAALNEWKANDIVDFIYHVNNQVAYFYMLQVCNASAVKSALGTGSETTTYLRNDGTWQIPEDTKPIVISLDTVTNTSGSYTHSTTVEYAVASMKPLQLECSNPDAFQDSVTVEIGNGIITLSCNNVIGTSDVSIVAMITSNEDPTGLNTTEFDILAGRIGDISALTTNTKTSVVSAINELNTTIEAVEDSIPLVYDNVTSTSTTDALSANQGKVLQSEIDNIFHYTSMASSESLDDAELGFVYTASGVTNNPTVHNYIVMTFGTSNTKIQLAFRVGSTVGPYFRARTTSGGWGAWKQLQVVS